MGYIDNIYGRIYYYYVNIILPNVIYKYSFEYDPTTYYNINNKVNEIYIEGSSNITIYSTNLGGTSIRYYSSSALPSVNT